MEYHRLFKLFNSCAASQIRANSAQNVKIPEVHRWDLFASTSELISTVLYFCPWSLEPQAHRTAPPTEVPCLGVGHATPSHLKDTFLRLH